MPPPAGEYRRRRGRRTRCGLGLGGLQPILHAGSALTAGRHRVATLHAGRDEDAALKSRLTGVPLDNFILAVDLYR